MTSVINDLWLSSDYNIASALILLDLSAAFDTVDHAILVHRLRQVGVTGSALSWLTSFLQDRLQSVRLGQFCSPQDKLVCGVLQGSSLSPLLFNVYLQPLIATTLDRMDCCIFNYADDTNLILRLEGSTQSQSNVQCIIRFIPKWMSVTP